MSGLLIVNADDFGGNALANERIVECFAAGAITSTTAMVYMSHSEQAAELSRGSDLAIGLHLNLTQPFDGPSVPDEVRRRQARVSARLSKHRHRYVFDPALFGEVHKCIDDQLRRFVRLFGTPPTHLDGHNHGHLGLTALMALPRGIAVRTAESDVGAGPLGRVVRVGRHRLIAHRHATTDYFFAIERVRQARRPAQRDSLLALSRSATVEIMTHPDRDRDYALLSSETWLKALRELPTGSYAQLRERGGRTARQAVAQSLA